MTSILPLAPMLRLMLSSYKTGLACVSADRKTYQPRNQFRDALHRFLSPLDYFRYGELPLTRAALGPIKAGDRLLDLSSPKLLALHLAASGNKHVTATDLLEENLVETRLAAKALHVDRELLIETTDGRKLPYPDQTFDHVFSVSVLEHIPGDGDTAALLEMKRVLKPGGSLVITVPCRPKAEDKFLHQDVYERAFDGSQPVFWCRYYDQESLNQRLIQPASMDLVGQQYLFELRPFWEWFCRLPKRSQQALMPFWPVLAVGLLRVQEELPYQRPLSIALLKLAKQR